METTEVFWGFIGMMENRMETTVVYWGLVGIMKKLNGNYCSSCSILGLYRDNGI